MFESPKTGKIVAIVLVFVLSASLFSFYVHEESTQNLEQNFSVVVLKPNTVPSHCLTWTAFVYNQYGKPVPNLTIEVFGAFRNTTNEYGCSTYKLHLSSGISMPPIQTPGTNSAVSKFSFSTIFGTHKFNRVSCLQANAPQYFTVLVQSPSDPSEPAIMVHYFAEPGVPGSNYISCVTLSCYKSNHTIQYGSNPQEKLLGTYQNFTNIVIPISKYLTTDENYQFITGGIFTNQSQGSPPL